MATESTTSLLAGVFITAISTKYANANIVIDTMLYASLALLVVILLWQLFMRLMGRFVPLRFANLIFLLDKNDKLAVIRHPHYKRVQPPGKRLGYHERPHEAVAAALKKEIGIDDFCLMTEPPQMEANANSRIVPRPFQVQVERSSSGGWGPHKLGVREHYDFLYYCRTDQEAPQLAATLGGQWMSVDELEKLATSNVKSAPWESIIPAYKFLLANKDRFAPYQQATP